jgi:hypothetical protein
MLNEGYNLKESYISNNKWEHSDNGASDNNEYLDQTFSITYVSDCSGNTSLSENSDTITTHHKIGTEVPPKSKSKTKLPPQPKGSAPLTVYLQNIRGLKGKVNALVSQFIHSPNSLSYTLSF